MTLGEFTSLLAAHNCKPTGSGSQISARCLAHEDNHASLSISVGADGRVLVHCHAGCKTKDICAKLGIKESDLFGANGTGKSSGRKIVATYPYQNEQGELLFEVVRFDPKDFRQRQPDKSAKDGWVWNTKGVPRVLFRLPELRCGLAKGLPVFIPEGEKDVMALVARGFTATCNCGGADDGKGNKWLPQYSETLRDADVIVIADKDAAGRTHAAYVANSVHCKARAVRVLELPDVGGKRVKDAADYFAAGGTTEDLITLVDKAQPWTPSQAPASTSKDLFTPIPWTELKKPVSRENTLLGDRFLERPGGLLLFGPAGCGKSVAGLQGCYEWAAGLDGLHIKPPRPLRIVIIQTEDSLDDTREALAGIRSSSFLKPEHHQLAEQNLIILPPVPAGDPLALAHYMDSAAARFSPDILYVNPLLAFCPGDPSREMGGILYQCVDPVIKRHHVGFVGIHHTTKTNTRDTSGYGAHDYQYLAAGDARVANWPRAMIMIEPVGDGIYLFRVAKRWQRCGWVSDGKPVSERYFQHAKHELRWLDATPEAAEQAQSADDYRDILAVLPDAGQPGISRDRVRSMAKTRLKIGKAKADSWLKLAIEDKVVARVEVPTESNRREVLFRRSA